MSIYWLVLALPFVGYELLVRHEMRRPVAVRYNRLVARFLRLVVPASMRCVSLWTTAWMLFPPNDVRGQLSAKGRTHEFYHLTAQWALWPRTFLFRYAYEEWRVGYAKNKYEQAARRVAGQPER